MTTLATREVALEELNEGDRIEFTAETGEREGQRVTGTVFLTPHGGVAVQRDDGVTGGAMNGGWILFEAEMDEQDQAPYLLIGALVDGTEPDYTPLARPPIIDLRIGDRIRARNVVEVVATIQTIYVPGQHVCCTVEGTGSPLCVTDANYLGLADPPDPEAPRPMRAVFCACCAKPTGEWVEAGNQPEHVFCVQCRDLPGPWEVQPDHTTEPGRRINREEDTRYTPTIGAQGGGLAPPVPVDEDLEDEDDEPQQLACEGCGGTEFEVEFRAYANVYVDADGTDADETLRFDPPENRTDWDADDDPTCTSCGVRFRGNWDVRW